MTVIASFNVNQCPVIFGDLLISGDEDLHNPLNVPTIGETTKIFGKGSGFVPTDLRQKTAIVNDNLALAWAGAKIPAQMILKELVQRAKEKALWSFDDLSRFFSDFDNECAHNVGIVGWSNDGKGIFSFGYGTSIIKYQSEKYGLVRLCGSGAQDLKSYLDSFDIPPASRTTNLLETAVGNTLAITTYMTGLERITGSNLIKYYGGGFEIVSFVRRKFTKIDDITYLVWVGQQMSNMSWRLSLPEVAIKYYYYGDILLIGRAEFESHMGGRLKCKNEAIHVISPIYRIIEDSELKKVNRPSFNSRFICSFIILHSIDGSVQILNRINYSSQQTNPIRFIDVTSDVLHMEIQHDFIKSVFDGCMANNSVQRA